MRKLISALIGMQLILLISTCAAQENTGTVSGPGLTAGDCTSGPDTCIQGFVWREAGPDDHVCVPPAIRDQTLGDNGQAAARRNPNGGPTGRILPFRFRLARGIPKRSHLRRPEYPGSG